MKSISILTLLLAIVVATTSCQTGPLVFQSDHISTDPIRVQRIQVHNHGKHTGISLPASKLNESIPALSKRFGDVRYYEIGWGDAGFYQAKKITSRLSFRAIFWPTETVMHVVGFNEEPASLFPYSQTHELLVTDQSLEGMIQFIASSFERDSEGEVISKRHGIYGESQFYEAEGSYFLFNTCNKWTAKALRSGGLDIGVPFKITSGAVMRDLKKQAQPHGLVIDPSPPPPVQR